MFHFFFFWSHTPPDLVLSLLCCVFHPLNFSISSWICLMNLYGFNLKGKWWLVQPKLFEKLFYYGGRWIELFLFFLRLTFEFYGLFRFSMVCHFFLFEHFNSGRLPWLQLLTHFYGIYLIFHAINVIWIALSHLLMQYCLILWIV